MRLTEVTPFIHDHPALMECQQLIAGLNVTPQQATMISEVANVLSIALLEASFYKTVGDKDKIDKTFDAKANKPNQTPDVEYKPVKEPSKIEKGFDARKAPPSKEDSGLVPKEVERDPRFKGTKDFDELKHQVPAQQQQANPQEVAKQAATAVQRAVQKYQTVEPIQDPKVIDSLVSKVNGGSISDKLKQATKQIGEYAKKHPKMTNTLVGVLAAAASFAGSPIAGTIVGAALRTGIGLAKGESLAKAAGKAALIAGAGAAVGHLAGQAMDAIGGHATSQATQSAGELSGVTKSQLMGHPAFKEYMSNWKPSQYATYADWKAADPQGYSSAGKAAMMAVKKAMTQ